ncbi:MAG TPA: D-glycerate dehydrogenase [Chloroflexota bacterium]|nr:D-glycerate dehydrogenase [Chloroflexota bacterium]
MSKPKLFITRPVIDSTMARLSAQCEVSFWHEDSRPLQDEMERAIADAEACMGFAPWPAALMDKAPKLRIIANTAVGFDNVDVPAATQRGIVVTNTPNVLTDTTADLAFTLMLTVSRRICEADRFVRGGKWTMQGGPATFLGSDVNHATLGIIGLGRIGAEVAHRATGFHMTVLYYDPIRREELEKQFGYQYVDMDTLLAQSDFVSVHMPLMPQTKGLIGAAQFAKMKPTAFLINAARGPVVDEKALIAALKEKRIAGAGLDVFEQEPTPTDNPLLKMDNVVVAPHIGSATVATRQAMVDLAADNVLAVLAGKAPLTPVNPEVLSRLKK